MRIQQVLLAATTAIALPMAMGTAVAQTYTVNVVNGHPPIFLWVKHLTETFIPSVNAALDGTQYAIEWNEFYGGELAAVGGELEALEDGLAEIGVVPTVFEPSNLPLQNITYVTPFGSPSPELVLSVVDDLHANVPGVVESWHTYDLEYLGGGFALDDYLLMTNFPVESLADLEGRRIGAPGPAVNWLEGTGAVGVSGNLTTYYNDLQTGVFDGVIVFATAAAPARLFEVAPYVTITNFGAQYAGSVVANRPWLESMPDEVQAAMRHAAVAYTEAYIAEQAQRIEGAMQAMVDGGATITQLPASERSAWAAALPNVPAEWAANADGADLPGTVVLTEYMDALRNADVELPRNWDQE
ncbi:MAG: C4-dicarboxylate TRAP transporter substrate-binding protein [Pseudomonadota bacterium]